MSKSFREVRAKNYLDERANTRVKNATLKRINREDADLVDEVEDEKVQELLRHSQFTFHPN